MGNDDLVDWADLAALKQLAKESCNGPHPVRIFLSWLTYFKNEWLGPGLLGSEARIEPCAVCGEYDPHGWEKILRQEAERIRYVADAHELTLLIQRLQQDNKLNFQMADDLYQVLNDYSNIARSAGITINAVREIVSALEGEEISFSKAVEGLRKLLLVGLDHAKEDLAARHRVDRWLMSPGRYLKWDGGSFYLIDTPAEVAIEGLSYQDLVDGLKEVGE